MPLDLAFHTTLLELLDTHTPSDVVDLLQPLISQGLVDLNMSVPTPHGGKELPLLAQWLPRVATYQWKTAIFEQLDAWAGPQWWAQADAKGRSVRDHMAAAVNTNGLSALLPLVQHLPRESWSDWTPPGDTYGNRAARGLTPEAGLVSWVLSHERYSNLRERDFGNALAEMGFAFTGRTTEGPVAYHISTVPQWEAFLSQGGDPLQKVPSRQDSRKLVPLWAYLRDDRDALRSTIETWAKNQPALQGQAERDAIAHYFEKATQAWNTADIDKAIRAREDWPTVRNASGQTVFMAVLEKRNNSTSSVGSASRLMDQAKGKVALAAKDAQGRNLWFYLVSSSDKTPVSGLMKMLIRAGVAPSPDHRGQGLLLQSLPEPVNDRMPNFHHRAFVIDWSDPEIRQALEQPAVWLAGSPDEQRRVLTWMTEQREPSDSVSMDLVDNLHKLGTVLEKNGADPFWMGAFVVNTLLDTRIQYSNFADDVARWQAQGALFQLSPQREAQLRAHAQKFDQVSTRARQKANPQAAAVTGATDKLEGVLQANALNWAAYQRTQDRQAKLQAHPVSTAPRPRPRYRA